MSTCVCVGLQHSSVSAAQVSGGSSGEGEERHHLHLLQTGRQQLPEGKNSNNKIISAGKMTLHRQNSQLSHVRPVQVQQNRTIELERSQVTQWKVLSFQYRTCLRILMRLSVLQYHSETVMVVIQLFYSALFDKNKLKHAVLDWFLHQHICWFSSRSRHTYVNSSSWIFTRDCLSLSPA